MIIQSVPSEDSDQTAQNVQADLSSCLHEETASLAIQNVPSEDSDQTAQERRLM